MQRRKSDRRFELLYREGIQQAMLAQSRATMHDAMPDGIGRGHSGRGQKFLDARKRLRCAGVCNRGCRQLLKVRRLHPEQAEFERR